MQTLNHFAAKQVKAVKAYRLGGHAIALTVLVFILNNYEAAEKRLSRRLLSAEPGGEGSE